MKNGRSEERSSSSSSISIAVSSSHFAPLMPLTSHSDGDHTMTDTANSDAFEGNAAISKVDSNLVEKADAPTETMDTETVATEPKPIEHVAPGITPVSDFMPKDAPTSHPTPPPDDEPAVTSDSNGDVVMTSVEEVVLPESTAIVQDATPDVVQDPVEPVKTAQPASHSATDSVVEPTNVIVAQSKPDEDLAPVSATSESSLVRPREEEDGDAEEEERAAKRTRINETGQEELGAAAVEASADANVNPAPAPVQTKVELDPEPKTDVVDVKQPAEEVTSANVQAAPVASSDPAADVEPKATDSGSKPVGTEVKAAADPPVAPRSLASASTTKYSTQPMTQAQSRFLQEKMKNLKKTKNSLPFLHRVDPIALNIPSYTEIIKQPMDLGTMEQKLKGGKYGTVQDFADDFNLIIHNTQTFNGPGHAVTQAGMAMEAYFRKMMETVPSANQPAPAKAQPKKASPKPPALARRESRSAHPAPTPAITGTSEPFALQPDGTPQIRRESTTNRPARVIKPPPARELAYAKPKRKEHQLELKFAEDVLDKIRGPKYAALATVFLTPVDPVALNIPHYRQIVKNPMDLGTMTQKLKNGQYSRASEVKKDFDLMISNCLAFNPNGNPVRDMGIQLQREFESLWREKEKWEKKQRQARVASASDDEESAEEEEDEEEEQPQDAAQTILALQKQLADMQNALAGLGQPPKPKKAKAAKSHSKKSSAAPAPKSKPAPAPKTKAKKGARDVTYEEKQEISEAVGKMNAAQVEQLTQIITSNCQKYAEQEEMELEIDDLPNNVQAMLLTFVRGIFGNPRKKARAVTPDDGAGADDDDFEPGERRGAKSGGGKRKKHKPMGKDEQQKVIDNIEKQLARFQGEGGAGSGGSPNNMGFAAGRADADTSGDESESEEE